MFIQSCLRPIASTLLIQQCKTFEEVISQAIIIEKVKIQDGEMKTKKKEFYVKNKNQIEKTSKPLLVNIVSINKEVELNPPQNEEKESKPKRNFTPL